MHERVASDGDTRNGLYKSNDSSIPERKEAQRCEADKWRRCTAQERHCPKHRGRTRGEHRPARRSKETRSKKEDVTPNGGSLSLMLEGDPQLVFKPVAFSDDIRTRRQPQSRGPARPNCREPAETTLRGPNRSAFYQGNPKPRPNPPDTSPPSPPPPPDEPDIDPPAGPIRRTALNDGHRMSGGSRFRSFSSP